MKIKIKIAPLTFLLWLVSSVLAENNCVREGATGSNDGSDWINAFAILPDTLIRGDTYYIADGNYCPDGYTFDVPMDGEKYITILKATDSSHGTDTGWDSQYGDGQAVFTEMLAFKSSYWRFDGIVGSGPDSTSYGFKVKPDETITDAEHYLIKAPHSGDIDYIQISHCSLTQLGRDWNGQDGKYGQCCLYVGGDDPTDHYIISHNYMAFASTCLILYNSSNTIVENNYFSTNWSSPDAHGQLVAPGWDSDDVIFRNNIFYLPTIFVFGAHVAGSERWQVYNNIAIGDGSKVNAGFANATSADTNIILNSEFHHNTFYNMDFGRGAIFIGYLSGNVADDRSIAYNNIYCKIKDIHSGMNYTPGSLIYENNAYYDCWGIFNPGSTDIVADSIDPFVDLANLNFRLKEPVVTDKVLPPPFDVDFDGKVRGVDGHWDRGAFEYQSVDIKNSNTKPVNYTNLHITQKHLNKSLKISYTLVSPSFITLTIYSISGKEIYTPVNEFKNRGTYTTEIDIRELSSGIYLCRLLTELMSVSRVFFR